MVFKLKTEYEIVGLVLPLYGTIFYGKYSNKQKCEESDFSHTIVGCHKKGNYSIISIKTLDTVNGEILEECVSNGYNIFLSFIPGFTLAAEQVHIGLTFQTTPYEVLKNE